MLVEILRDSGTKVQPNPQEILDFREQILADLQRFLDRLVAESKQRALDETNAIFIRGDSDA